MLLLGMILLAGDVQSGSCTASQTVKDITTKISMPFSIINNRDIDVSPMFKDDTILAASSLAATDVSLPVAKFTHWSVYNSDQSFKSDSKTIIVKVKFAVGRKIKGPFVVTIIQNGKAIYQIPYPIILNGDTVTLSLNSGYWPAIDTQATGQFLVRYTGGEEVLAEMKFVVPKFVRAPIALPSTWPTPSGLRRNLPAECALNNF